jgi:hypothetical protein
MKDAFYFQHDSNAKSDLKCVRLRRLHGLAGYGLYWCVVESLRDATEFKLPLDQIDDLVFDLQTTREIFESLFDATGLLEKDETHFWSNRLLREMNKMQAKRRAAANAGKASGRARVNEIPTDVEQTLNEIPTDVEHDTNGIELKDKTIQDKKDKQDKQEKKYSPADLKAAREIFAMIRNLNPDHKEPSFPGWADDIRKLREIDHRTYQGIIDLFRWANNDSFWKTNILSPAKLREKWDQLTVKKNGTKAPQDEEELVEFGGLNDPSKR